jgi:hypothetical protein
METIKIYFKKKDIMTFKLEERAPLHAREVID